MADILRKSEVLTELANTHKPHAHPTPHIWAFPNQEAGGSVHPEGQPPLDGDKLAQPFVCSANTC